MVSNEIPNSEQLGFYFQGLEEYCSGCPAFEPRRYQHRLGSGHIINYVECDNANQCRKIKSHLEKRLETPKK